MKHSVPHDLPFDLAKKAADAALRAYSEKFDQYDPEVTWTSERNAEVEFSVKGLTLKGSFELTDNSVDMDMEVPLLARPFRAKALEVVEGEIKRWLDKAKAGEL